MIQDIEKDLMTINDNVEILRRVIEYKFGKDINSIVEEINGEVAKSGKSNRAKRVEE